MKCARGEAVPPADLIDASSLGTRHALRMREVGGELWRSELTGMGPEQRDWELGLDDGEDDQ